MSAKQARTPKRLRQKAWDPLVDKYADLSSPEWLTERLPPRFWEDPHNHTRYITWLAKELEIKSLDDWYRVSCKEILNRRGRGLLAYHGGSHIQFITSMIKRRNWHIWKFNYVPRSFWRKKQHRVAYLKWLEKELGYKKPEDWYQVSHLDLRNNYGKVVAESGPFNEILSELYPKFKWNEWKFIGGPRGFWNKKSNRVRYMKWLSKELGFRKLDDFYQLTKRDYSPYYGRAIVDYYGGSPHKLLRDCWPDHDWKAWLFGHVPDGFWDVKKNRLDYLRWLGEQLGFETEDDWYAIEEAHFRAYRGCGLFQKEYRSLPQRGPMELFPTRKWHPWLFVQTPKGFWDKKANRMEYMKWLGKQLGFKTKKDWQQLQNKHFFEHRGHSLVSSYPHKKLLREFRPAYNRDRHD